MGLQSVRPYLVIATIAGALFVAGCSPGAGGPGAALFAERCAPCHGAAGKGVTGSAAPPLNRPQFVYGRSREAIAASIRDGRPREMPAYGGFLNRQQIDDLVSYILAL
jgi:cytochrome c oxidase cbb3-type subunit 3